MDIGFFLNERIKFIRQFYETSSTPYAERKRKIEAEEEPFSPPYSEDGEPPFLEEWVESDESLHVLAYSCVSMLAAALHLYFETWVSQSGCPVEESLKKTAFKKRGWFSGYKAHFSQRFAIQFDDAPVRYELIEEIILARNRIEHPTFITNQRMQYADSDIKNLRHPFFVDDREATLLSDADEGEKSWVFPPTLHVTAEKLHEAISEVERFIQWFEVEIEHQVYEH
jgi:hypothetical protein